MKKQMKKTMKEVQDVAGIESERIVNGLEKRGLKVVNRDETEMFMTMSIELITNKIDIMSNMPKLFGSQKVSQAIFHSAGAIVTILQAINGKTFCEKDFENEEFKKQMFDMHKYYALEVINLSKVFKRMCTDREE